MTQAEHKQIGSGINVFTRDEPIEGPILWLDSPEAVMDYVTEGDPNSIVISRGGATTFMAPALITGVKALITLQGAPESHLGILSREYGIPCVMSVTFTEGITTDRGETIPADGTIVRVDVSDPAEGRLLVAEGS